MRKFILVILVCGFFLQAVLFGGADCTATSATINGEKHVYFTTTGSAGTVAGEVLGLHISADAEL